MEELLEFDGSVSFDASVGLDQDASVGIDAATIEIVPDAQPVLKSLQQKVVPSDT
jgi:hypothetical protein